MSASEKELYRKQVKDELYEEVGNKIFLYPAIGASVVAGIAFYLYKSGRKLPDVVVFASVAVAAFVPAIVVMSGINKEADQLVQDKFSSLK